MHGCGSKYLFALVNWQHDQLNVTQAEASQFWLTAFGAHCLPGYTYETTNTSINLKDEMMRYLHTMIRAADLDKTLSFFVDHLGLVEVRVTIASKAVSP